VNTTRRGRKILALAAASAVILAACGSDDDSGSGSESTDAGSETTEATEGTDAPDTTDDMTETTDGGEEGAGEAVFRITYELSDTAVWNDGTPITAADFECGWKAALGTPGSLSTAGYDSIISVEEGDSPSQVVVEMDTVYAPYKTLWDAELLKSDEIEDCNDVTDDFEGGIPFSGREWIQESWSPEQIVWVPNPGYTGDKVPQTERMVIVPAEDGATLLKSGDVDFIFPQAYTGIDDDLNDPNIEYDSALGGSYEAFYFMQVKDDRAGPFADDDFRQAFSKSIDMDGVYDQIYAPLAQGAPLLTCGPIAPGPYCDPTTFEDTYDPDGAEQILTDAGWTKNGEGLWESPDGEVPEVRFMVSSPNPRRESTQAYLIPLLREAGFNVVADNCEAVPCVFQTRLPGLDYDMTMYISTVSPDPTYLLDSFSCDSIPTEENGFQGQGQQGWCNEEASALLAESDVTINEEERAALVKEAIKFMREDAVLLPLLQFPNVGAYRSDKVANTQAELANYRAVNDWYQWEDVDGDGQIVFGAEQFPDPSCPNPINECANSSWYVWTVSFAALPAPFDATADNTFEITEMLASEPVVEEL
jgi:peptide/nickel transport system substrate-binding protein